MRNARLDEPQAEIKIAGRNINSFRYAGDTILMAENILTGFLFSINSPQDSLADSLCCTVETNTKLSSNYTPI